MGLSSRDVASLMWIGVLVLAVFIAPPFRVQGLALLRQLRNWKLWLPVLLLAGLTAGLCAIAARVEWWNSELLYPTVSWFATTVVVLLFQLPKAMRGETVIRKALMDSIKFAVVLQLLANLFPLGLGWELLLVPLVAFLALLAAVAGRSPGHRPVKTSLEVVLAGVALTFVVTALVRIVRTYNGADYLQLVRTLGMPVWLTVGVAPAVYLLYLLAAYEVAFSAWRLRSLAASQRRRTLVARVLSDGYRVATVGTTPAWVSRRAGEANSDKAARRVYREHRESLRQKAREEEAARQRLRDMAGVQGEGEDGRQLDRREFSETVKALSWLATVQMGQHHKGGRYRDDALQIIGDFERHGLPGDPGISLTVSPDGQKWWAYRRAITGWVFAIGAAHEPPDQWQYDGPEPPSGFPGEAPEWADDAFSIDAARNW